MLWAEVYAGGIGGFVARLRPDVEPPPHTARRQYLAWCREQDVPWRGEGEDYDVRREEHPPLIADDADVAVIAAHASRMALDVLLRPTETTFPHTAYVIGLSAGWIFDAPFDTHPFDFVPEGAWQNPAPEKEATDAVDFILSLLSPPDPLSPKPAR